MERSRRIYACIYIYIYIYVYIYLLIATYVFISIFFKIKLKIFLFLALLGLCCYVWAFSSCGEWGLLSIVVHGLLIAVASLVVEHGLQAHRLQ